MTRKALVVVVCVATGALWVCMHVLGANAQAAAGDQAAKEEIAGVLKAYVAAFEAKDIAGVMKMFADGENTVMMGTGKDETWVGKENIQAAHNCFFANIKKETSERKLLASQVNGNMAWLDGYTISKQATETGEQTFQLNLSIVMEKQGADWRIISLHFSRLSIPEQG